jgi:hypothetical protein
LWNLRCPDADERSSTQWQEENLPFPLSFAAAFVDDKDVVDNLLDGKMFTDLKHTWHPQSGANPILSELS